LLALWQDESGVIAVLAALALTGLIGVVGLALDVGMWYRTSRALQNAADAAVVAAALNGTGSYQSEAKAVAAQYGFVDGANGITVTALNNQTCPDGTTDCYQVTVAQASAPRSFSPVVGSFNPALAGTAMAGGSQTHSYCLLALAGSGTDPAILGNGSPKADLSNCSLMSNTGATCHGHNLNATYGDAHKINDNCGITEHSNVPVVADPYSSLASSIPPWSCPSGYPQETKKGNLPASNQWSAPGSKALPAKTIVCGDLQITGSGTLSLTAAPGSVLVIVNGQLDSGSATLQTAGLTIIFTGTAGNYTHAPTGGAFSISKPRQRGRGREWRFTRILR
jgi:Flp pilus assembly protein TadG